MNLNKLTKAKTLMMIQREKEKKQKIRSLKRKINRGKGTKINSNQMFDQFCDGLRKYFSEHKMPVQSIEFIDYTGTELNYNFTVSGKPKIAKKVVKIFDEDYCNITIIPHLRGVELFRLEIYQTGKGIGSIFMKAFNQISKELNIPIYLIPADPGLNGKNGDPVKRRDFYHKFDFKRTSNSDYWNNENYLNNAA